MKLILIRSPQLFFYKMKSKKEDKEHDDGYNYSFIRLRWPLRAVAGCLLVLSQVQVVF